MKLITTHKINKIFTIFSTICKEPKTELYYLDNFTLAIAVILSAQATDISVNKVTKTLFNTYNKPQDFISLGTEGLKLCIKTIGLYNTKARNIIALSEILVKTKGEIPSELEELLKLPGIGRKTANVILNCAFGKDAVAVDTHVARVAQRLGLTKNKIPEKIELDLIDVIPKIWLKNAHNWLVLHGRYICKAKKPECFKCPIYEWCRWEGKIEKD